MLLLGRNKTSSKNTCIKSSICFQKHGRRCGGYRYDNAAAIQLELGDVMEEGAAAVTTTSNNIVTTEMDLSDVMEEGAAAVATTSADS